MENQEMKQEFNQAMDEVRQNYVPEQIYRMDPQNSSQNDDEESTAKGVIIGAVGAAAVIGGIKAVSMIKNFVKDKFVKDDDDEDEEERPKKKKKAKKKVKPKAKKKPEPEEDEDDIDDEEETDEEE